MQCMNVALTAKFSNLVWNILIKVDKLWVKMLSSKYM